MTNFATSELIADVKLLSLDEILSASQDKKNSEAFRSAYRSAFQDTGNSEDVTNTSKKGKNIHRFLYSRITDHTVFIQNLIQKSIINTH